MGEDGRLVIGEVAEEMSAGFRRHRQLIVRLTILFAILNGISNLLNVTGPAGTALSAGILLLLSVAYGGLITALLCVPGESPESGSELWARVAPLLARLIWVTLITLAAVIAGLMVFFIPGLILLTMFAVATQVVVVERSGAFASLGRSAELVRGNGFRVFGFILLLGIACLLLIMLLLLATVPIFGDGTAGTTISTFLQNLIVAPLFAIGPAALYNLLRRGPGSLEEPVPPA